MGSSVRKTSAKIKKLLKETIDLNPTVSTKEVIPQVATETLRSKKTKGYFGDKDFAVLAGGGFACFKKMKAIGLDNFLQEYIEDNKKLTLPQVSKVIEAILDGIEEENGEIESMLILAAFKNAMTKMLLNKIEEPSEFLTNFCEMFIASVIREDASEELTSAFKDTSIDIFDNDILEFSEHYVKEKFSDLILRSSNDELDIKELIQKMQEVIAQEKE